MITLKTENQSLDISLSVKFIEIKILTYHYLPILKGLFQIRNFELCHPVKLMQFDVLCLQD